MPLVEVTWIDACSSGGPGWVDREEALEFAVEPAPVMRTIGFLIHEDFDEEVGFVALTDTIGEDECACVHKIPYSMILSRRPL